MDKVSVIIGLYNVAGYLRTKRLSCILSQSYQNIEVILVNDGSTDDTLDICNELANEDKRIKIIDKENGGLGSARNAGLDASTGEYVWFYDVDDEAELTLIDKNVAWMRKYQVDMIVFGFMAITPHLNTTEQIRFNCRYIEGNKALKSIYVDELLFVPNGNGFVWNKFYRKSFIDKYSFRFGDQRIQQDELFNLQLYPVLERLYISSEILYKYYIYNNGPTRCNYIKNRYDIYLSVFNRIKSISEEWTLKSDKLIDYAYRRLYSGLETSILFNAFHHDSQLSFKEKRDEVHAILNNQDSLNCLEYIANHCNFNIEQRMFLYAYRHHSFMCIYLLRIISSLMHNVYNVIR